MPKKHYNPDEHLVDILVAPEFLPSGKTQGIVEAIRNGDWLHTTDVWVYRSEPTLQILFQQRHLNSPTHAGKLDCSVAGYLEAGETPLEGALREMHEELGIRALPEKLRLVGRRFNAMIDHHGRERRIVANSHILNLDSLEDHFQINPDEVYAIFWISAEELKKIHSGASITVEGRSAGGEALKYSVSKDDFVYNVDDYHFRIAERLQLLHESSEL